MSYTPESRILKGLSIDKATLFGMPHIGCKYIRESINATAWETDYRRCAYCGRTQGFHSRHHEPPRSNRAFLLETPMGKHVLLPALIDLCGTGTTGCHGDRHNGKLSIRWEWDSDENARKWWEGEYLSLPYHEPHGIWLYSHGCYVFTKDGMERRYRE